MFDRALLHSEGYVLLRQAIPAGWLDELRACFDAGVKPSEQWPAPRGLGWRHAHLDLEPRIQALCRLPVLLDAVGELVGETFFLAQAEGREPLPGGGHQPLHRDLCSQRPGDTVNALAFFDDYGPHNGATRLVPGSHRPAAGDGAADESRAIQLSGRAGDILVFDADLLHGASLHPGTARRRSVLVGYFAAPLYDAHLATAALRGVRMDCSERFDPAACRLAAAHAHATAEAD